MDPEKPAFGGLFLWGGAAATVTRGERIKVMLLARGRQ